MDWLDYLKYLEARGYICRDFPLLEGESLWPLPDLTWSASMATIAPEMMDEFINRCLQDALRWVQGA